MKEVKEEEEEEEEEEVEEENSDISGYHSDSDSTVMMSGNSPFISKTARYNFLSRSGTLEISQYEISNIQYSRKSTSIKYPHILVACKKLQSSRINRREVEG